MKRVFFFLVTLLTIFPAAAKKPSTKAQAYIDRIAAEEPLRSAVWGVLAVNGKGDTLAVLNPVQKMVPASNMKLLTTGAALHTLGADFQFETAIGYTGAIQSGILKGDVYIIGGGDPTLAAPDSIATSAFTLFSRWKAFLSKAGIKQIDGRIIGDGRYLDGAPENPSWNWEDLGTDYGTGGSGLCFYENQKEFSVKAGAAVGDPVTIREGYPETPWMQYTFNGTTARAHTGDELYLFTSDQAPTGAIRGTFAVDRKPRTEKFANKFGALTCAYHFYKYLSRTGISTTGGPADIDCHGLIRCGFETPPSEAAAIPDSIKILGKTLSPPLSKICRETNHRSDNFYAETLLRTLGKREKGVDNYDSCQVVLKGILEKIGADCSEGIRIEDGSGLSRRNYVSPGFMVRFLSAMRSSPAWNAYLAGLPVPGANGTMRMVLPSLPKETKDRIHLKSGSMNGVLCYSGYITPKPGGKDTICFSILTNNATAEALEVRPLITKIIALLAE